MIYFWRFLFLFGILNLMNLIGIGGGHDMRLIWIGIIVLSFILSFKKVWSLPYSTRPT